MVCRQSLVKPHEDIIAGLCGPPYLKSLLIFVTLTRLTPVSLQEPYDGIYEFRANTASGSGTQSSRVNAIVFPVGACAPNRLLHHRFRSEEKSEDENNGYGNRRRALTSRLASSRKRYRAAGRPFVLRTSPVGSTMGGSWRSRLRKFALSSV